MPNYFVSYDLNGVHPTHAEMDEHLKKLGRCSLRALETVWYVKYSRGQDELYEYVNSLLTNNDRVLIIDARNCTWRNMLVQNDVLKGCWNA